MKEQLQNYLKDNELDQNKELVEKVFKIAESDRYKPKEKVDIPSTRLSNLSITEYMGTSNEIDFKKPILKITGLNGTRKTFTARLPEYMLFNTDKVINGLTEKKTRNKLTLLINDVKYELLLEKKDWILFNTTDQADITTGQTNIIEKFSLMGIDKSIDDLIFIKNENSYITEKDPRDFKKIILSNCDTINIELVKEDIKKKKDDKEKDIENRNGQIEALKSDEGINSIELEIKNIKKEVTGEKKLKDELLSITTDGADIVSKKLIEINDLKDNKSSNEDKIEDIKFVEDNKTVFIDLNNKEVELKNLNEVISKIESQQSEIRRGLIDKRELLSVSETSLAKLKEIKENKCPTCDQEVSEMRVQTTIKEKEDLIKPLNTEIQKLERELNSFDSPGDPTVLETNIEGFKGIIKTMNGREIKTQDDIDKYLSDNDIEKIKKENIKIDNDVLKLNTEYDKLVQLDKSKRKEEIEKQLEDIKEKEIKLGGLETKKKTIKENEKKINDHNKDIETFKTELENLEMMFKVFDKNNKNSFPAWLINDTLKNVIKNVNSDLSPFKFDNKQLAVEVNEKFEFLHKEYKNNIFCNSSNRILNIVLHINLLKLKFDSIPFFIIDDYTYCLDSNTKATLNQYINEKIKDKSIGNLIITDPTTEKLKIESTDKL